MNIEIMSSALCEMIDSSYPQWYMIIIIFGLIILLLIILVNQTKMRFGRGYTSS